MKSILELGAWIAKGLGKIIPPRIHQNGDKDLVERTQRYQVRLRHWQWAVFTCLIVLILGLSTQTVLSWGYEPYVEGFVKKVEYISERDAVKAKLTENLTLTQRIEIRLLEKDMLDTRTGQCRSTDKGYFTWRLQELRREYQTMTNSYWHTPDCKEVLDQ